MKRHNLGSSHSEARTSTASTTNSATGTVWVENLATSLGLLVTPAEVGFAGSSVKCPAAANPALAE